MRRFALLRCGVLAVFCFFFSFSTAYGQITASKDTFSARSKRWELGVDLLPLLVDSSRFGKTSFLVKRRVSERVWLRSRVAFGFEVRKNRDNNPISGLIDELNGETLRGHLSLGLERHVGINRFSAFYGMEIFGQYYHLLERSKFDNSTTTNQDKAYTIRDDHYQRRFGANALFGANLRLTRTLYLSVESFFQLAIKREKAVYEQKGINVTNAGGGRTLKRYIADFEPISSIQIMYQF